MYGVALFAPDFLSLFNSYPSDSRRCSMIVPQLLILSEDLPVSP